MPRPGKAEAEEGKLGGRARLEPVSPSGKPRGSQLPARERHIPGPPRWRKLEPSLPSRRKKEKEGQSTALLESQRERPLTHRARPRRLLRVPISTNGFPASRPPKLPTAGRSNGGIHSACVPRTANGKQRRVQRLGNHSDASQRRCAQVGSLPGEAAALPRLSSKTEKAARCPQEPTSLQRHPVPAYLEISVTLVS